MEVICLAWTDQAGSLRLGRGVMVRAAQNIELRNRAAGVRAKALSGCLLDWKVERSSRVMHDSGTGARHWLGETEI